MTGEDLNCLVAELPAERVTVRWLTEHLAGESTELILIVMGLIAMMPGASAPIAFLLPAPAIALTMARGDIPLPRRVSELELPSGPVRRLLGFVAAATTWWNRHGVPGDRIAVPGMKRSAGWLVLLLVPALLLPLPFSNVVPGLVIAALAFACLERDVILFGAAALAALLVVVAGAFGVLALGGELFRVL